MQERQIKLKGLLINYKIIGDGQTPIVLLHGWGVSSDKYVITAEEILKYNNDFKFYIPDLPGFGKSEEPKDSWNIDNYVEFAKEFIKCVARRETGFELVKNIIKGVIQNNGQSFSKNNKKIVLLAHSFGGRIAIKYGVKYPDDLKALVLTGAAGVKHSLSKKQKFSLHAAKIGKAIFDLPILKSWENYAKKILYKIIPDKDYGKASPRMKEIMKNAIGEDLTDIIGLINVSTILIWGRNDRSTPLADGEFMQKEIKNSKLFIIEDANHSAIYNNAQDFAKIFSGNNA